MNNYDINRINCQFITDDIAKYKCGRVAKHYYYDPNPKRINRLTACCDKCNMAFGYVDLEERIKITQKQYLSYQVLK